MSGNYPRKFRRLPPIDSVPRDGDNLDVGTRNADTRIGVAAMKAKSLSLVVSFLLMACAGTQGSSRDLQLIRAAERGQTKEMFRLIKAGADINAIDPEGWTPYLAASSMGHFEAMRMLRAFGARTEAPDPELEAENASFRYLSKH